MALGIFEKSLSLVMGSFTDDPRFEHDKKDEIELIYEFLYKSEDLEAKIKLSGFEITRNKEVVSEIYFDFTNKKENISGNLSFDIIEILNELGSKIASDNKNYYDLQWKLSKKSVIYKITNKKTGMCYVGKTENHFLHRWKEHFKNPQSTKFHRAIKESSEIDWIFEVVEEIIYPEGIKSVSEADKFVFSRENHWIKELDCIENGYNSK